MIDYKELSKLITNDVNPETHYIAASPSAYRAILKSIDDCNMSVRLTSKATEGYVSSKLHFRAIEVVQDKQMAFDDFEVRRKPDITALLTQANIEQEWQRKSNPIGFNEPYRTIAPPPEPTEKEQLLSRLEALDYRVGQVFPRAEDVQCYRDALIYIIKGMK